MRSRLEQKFDELTFWKDLMISGWAAFGKTLSCSLNKASNFLHNKGQHPLQDQATTFPQHYAASCFRDGASPFLSWLNGTLTVPGATSIHRQQHICAQTPASNVPYTLTLVYRRKNQKNGSAASHSASCAWPPWTPYLSLALLEIAVPSPPATGGDGLGPSMTSEPGREVLPLYQKGKLHCDACGRFRTRLPSAHRRGQREEAVCQQLCHANRASRTQHRNLLSRGARFPPGIACKM